VQEPVGSGNIAYANFTVSLSQAPQGTATVNYATVDGTAGNGYGAATIAHGDYGQMSGTLTFTPTGSLTQTVTVPVYPSGLTQTSRFSLQLSGATGSTTITKAIGIGTITVCGNPGASATGCPLLQISDPTVTEPLSGQTNATFTLQLSQAPQTPASVQYTTQDGTATAPTNYTKTTGTANFAVGQSTTTVTVPVNAVTTPHEPIAFQLAATSATGGVVLVPPYSIGVATVFSPYVEFKVQMGQFTPGASAPKLVKAGTVFALHVTIHNYRPDRVEVAWIYPELSGNATDGQMLPADHALPAATPSGALSEADPNPYIVLNPPNPSNTSGTLAPGEQQEFNIAVATTASNVTGSSANGSGPNGATRAIVKLETPQVWTLDSSNNKTALDQSYLQLDRDAKLPPADPSGGWPETDVGIDDSAPAPPPFGYPSAVGHFAVGLVHGFWNLAWGPVQGAWQLMSYTVPNAIATGLQSATSFDLMKYIDYQLALWNAMDDAQRAQFIGQLTNEIEQVAYAATPWELQDEASALGQSLSDQINQSVLAYYTKLNNDWYAGDWRQAEEDLVDSTTQVAGQAVVAEVGLSRALLGRAGFVEEALQTAAAKATAKAAETIAPLISGVVDAAQGIKALDAVQAGFEFTNTQLAKMVGLTPEQSAWLRQFCKENKVIITLRSRAYQAIKWVEDYGAVLKPEWIKLKTINWYDRYLGVNTNQIGKVLIMDRLPNVDEVYATLRRFGVRENSGEWNNALLNYANRIHEYSSNEPGLVKWIESQAREGTVTERFNVADNGLDATDLPSSVLPKKIKFHLVNNGDGTLTPEIYARGRFRFFTGDIDLTSIADITGKALSDSRMKQILLQLRDGPIGIQHPAAATWQAPNGDFLFDLKEKYLYNAGKPQVQFAPDGIARAVVFNKNLNDNLQAFNFFNDRNNYYIWWDGGYEEP